MNATPIALADMGSYVSGGRDAIVTNASTREISLSPGLKNVTYDPNGRFRIEQAYVQYFVPAARSCELPLLLIHGGGLTGATWETTPDGRPGWLNCFLALGFETHVIDMVERGRSGFCAVPGFWEDPPICRSAEEAWALFRIGPASDFPARRSFDGQAFPTEAFDDLVARQVPRWTHTGTAQAAALEAVAERIGPCMLIGHSQGGGHAIELAARRPDLVQATVALEPHGDFDLTESPDLYGRGLLVLEGDFLDLAPGWKELSARFGLVIRKWKEARGEAIKFTLSDHGMRGHSHMMMMDRGGGLIAAKIAAWLEDAPR